jgi:hypothetical protein
MTWPQGNIDSGRFDQDSDRISESRPELFKIAVATNQIANTFDPAGAEANNLLSYNAATSRFEAAGNITVGTVTATGTVTAGSFVGDGSQLTGLPTAYGDANVATLLGSFGSNSVSTTGTVTAGSFAGNGSQLTGLPPAYGDADVANLLATFGSNSVSTTGNVTANLFFGNGSQLTGLPTAGNSFSNVNANGTVLSADSATDTLNIVAGSGIAIAGNAATDTLTISATGNATTTTDKVAGSFNSGVAANTTSETKSLSVLIPANTFSAGDVIEIHTQWITQGGSTTNHSLGKIYINTSDNIGGSEVRAFISGGSITSLNRLRLAMDIIASNGNTRGYLAGGSSTTLVVIAAGFGRDTAGPGPATYNINWTINQYVILTGQVFTGQTGGIQAVGYQIYKR